MNVLIIDDDTYVCRQLDDYLRGQGHSVVLAHTANSGLKRLKKRGVDLVLCDYRLPDAEGSGMLERIRKIDPFVPLAFMTAYADVRTAVKMIQAGALDYLVKPFLPEEIRRLLKKVSGPSATTEQDFSRDFIMGNSAVMRNLMKQVELVAPTEISVLIEGETGSGKEYIARAIHYQGPRKDRPFVALDCGALPGELANSELFGHVKGAFTGAIKDKTGCFEEAEGGTLFLDEIGNLSHENQVRLLRTLQERTISRLGDSRSIAVDVRIITATNEDLMQGVRKGGFREDLYHRINGFKIILPPLRERKEDILAFALHFLERARQEFQRSVHSFSQEVMEIFNSYGWPGNIREVENVVNRCVLLTQGEVVEADSLPPEIRHFTAEEAGQPQHVSSGKPGSLKQVVSMAERQAIVAALEAASHNKSRAAKLLAVDRKTLYNKMREHKL